MSTAQKWLLRAALTALALLVTTDRRRPSSPLPSPKKPAE
jgi:hypothetical protein